MRRGFSRTLPDYQDRRSLEDLEALCVELRNEVEEADATKIMVVNDELRGVRQELAALRALDSSNRRVATLQKHVWEMSAFAQLRTGDCADAAHCLDCSLSVCEPASFFPAGVTRGLLRLYCVCSGDAARAESLEIESDSEPILSRQLTVLMAMRDHRAFALLPSRGDRDSVASHLMLHHCLRLFQRNELKQMQSAFRGDIPKFLRLGVDCVNESTMKRQG